MLEDVKNMSSHSYNTYTPENSNVKLICYKQMDGINFNMVKGYKTAFAYIQEWEKQ